MKLVQCAEGHYYDADISSTCPHCRKNEASVQEDATSVYLRKIGLLDCAEQQYHILVRLEDGRMMVFLMQIRYIVFATGLRLTCLLEQAMNMKMHVCVKWM